MTGGRAPWWRFSNFFFLPAVLSLALGGAAPQPLWSQVELPAPGDRSVHDLAGVLSPEHTSTMEALHRELFRKSGVAIVVITVSSLEDEPIEDFAVRVGEEWGAGKEGEDRGIVVALAIEERRVFIATGYGVESYLPDGRVGRILDRFAVPYLRRSDYSTAMLQTSAALVQASAEEYGVNIEGEVPRVVQRGRRDPGPLGTILGLLFMAGMAYLFFRHPTLFLLLLFSGRGRGGFGGGGFGGGSGFGGFGGGGFGGGGAGRSF